MPVALEKIKDEKTKDFIRILLSRNPDDRPTAEELLKNPFFDPEEDDSKVIYDPFKVSTSLDFDCNRSQWMIQMCNRACSR